jgi:hypothetical protein
MNVYGGFVSSFHTVETTQRCFDGGMDQLWYSQAMDQVLDALDPDALR